MKKLLALLLAVLMTATLFTVPAFADGEYLEDADMEGIDYTLGNGSWVVNIDADAADTTALAATSMTSMSGSNQSVAGSNGNTTKAAVYSIPLPEVPAGKVIKSAEFRMTSYYSTTQARAMQYSYKMPGEHDMSTITIGDMQKFVPGKNLGGGEYYLTAVKTGTEYSLAPDYRNRYDVTDYVNECIANNQENVFIAVAYGYTIKAYRHNVKGAEAKLFYTLEDAPALTAESSSVENGAENVYPFGDISVTFSNVIKSATATINGNAVPESDISRNGKVVTISYDESLSQATELVVNVTDVANQTLTHTISFTTADRYKYYDDSDMAGIDYTTGVASWKMTYGISASDTTTQLTDPAATSLGKNTNTNVGNAINAAVYKMKLPKIPEGKKFSGAEFRISAWYRELRFITHLYKMPGEDWNMDTLTIADAKKIIDAVPPANGTNFLVGCSSDKSYFDQATINRCKYEVTEYIKECIEAGQEYVWFAATYQSTIKAYTYDASGTNNARLYYTLEDVPFVKGTKIVSADSEAAYADATDVAPSVGDSIKAIAYMINNTETDVSLNVGVAQYKDGELVALSFVPYTLAAGTDASTIEFGATTVETDVDTIKAIIWDTSDNPVIKAKILEVK